MAKENEIIEFEDIFKENKNPEIPNKYQKENRHKYTSAIIVYALIMFVFAAILYLAMSGITSLQKTYTEGELIFENVAGDVDGVGIIPYITYYDYHQHYDDFVVKAVEYDNFFIIVNANNPDYETLFYNEDPDTNELILDIDAIYGVFRDMSITTWDDEISINILVGKTQSLPTYFLAEYEEIEGPLTTFSDLANSLLNFLVYVPLLPLLIIILKVDFISDFNEIKVKRSNWAPILALGYLYILLGNLFSKYTSEFLGGLLGIAPNESVNQMVIVNSLRSNGVVFMILSAVIIGPIVEELIFRKSIFGLFKSDRVGLIVSSLVFGFIHLIGEVSILAALVNGIAYFVMGFVFGYIYLKNNKNVFAPMAVHIFSNLVSILAILFYL